MPQFAINTENSTLVGRSYVYTYEPYEADDYLITYLPDRFNIKASFVNGRDRVFNIPKSMLEAANEQMVADGLCDFLIDFHQSGLDYSKINWRSFQYLSEKVGEDFYLTVIYEYMKPFEQKLFKTKLTLR